jgi:hypothetical protein
MNKIENMAKVALLLPNTDHHEQVQDYFKCCITNNLWYHLELVHGGQYLAEVEQPLVPS